MALDTKSLPNSESAVYNTENTVVDDSVL